MNTDTQRLDALIQLGGHQILHNRWGHVHIMDDRGQNALGIGVGLRAAIDDLIRKQEQTADFHGQ